MFILKYCTCAWWSIGGSPIWVGQYTLGTWASVVRKRFSLANCSKLLNVGTECSRKLKEDWCCMYSYRLAVWKMMDSLHSALHGVPKSSLKHWLHHPPPSFLPNVSFEAQFSSSGRLYFIKSCIYFLQQFAVNCNLTNAFSSLAKPISKNTSNCYRFNI